jgi:hypothetical protein
LSCFAPIRASPPVLGMWPCTLKFDIEKSTYSRTKRSQHTLVWLRKMVFLLYMCPVWWGWSAPAREECNKYDLTAAPHFWLVNRNDCSKWFAIGSSHLFVVPISVLWAGLQKSI